MTQEQLQELEAHLLSIGYKRYNEKHSESSAWQYYKSCAWSRDEHGERIVGYQCAVYIYDFSEFADRDAFRVDNPFSIAYKCFMGNEVMDGTMRLSCGGDAMPIELWEQRCEQFYKLIKTPLVSPAQNTRSG